MGGDKVLVFGEDGVPEGVFKVTSNDEDDVVEAGTDGIEDGVVHDGFSVRPDGVKLFEGAEAGADTGSEDEEGELLHDAIRY